MALLPGAASVAEGVKPIKTQKVFIKVGRRSLTQA